MNMNSAAEEIKYLESLMHDPKHVQTSENLRYILTEFSSYFIYDGSQMEPL